MGNCCSPGVLDEILNLIESVSEGFPSYSKMYRQSVGISMGTYYASLVAGLFLFCYERDFVFPLSEDNKSDVIETFSSTSRHLDDLLDIDNNFFNSMVNLIYTSELQLNKANVSDTEALFLD